MNYTARQEKLDTLFIVISLGWLFLWSLVCAAQGDWLFRGLSLLVTPVMAMGGVIFALSVARLFVLLTGKRAILKALLAMAVLIGAYLLGSFLPSRPALVFYLNRDEFVNLAEEAQVGYCGGGGFEFPSGALYRDANVYTDFNSGATVVEFLVGDFYLPLVYVSTDRAEDVYDTCSAGGFPLEKLAPNWYVCQRDWN